MAIEYEIHPSIGVARLGASPEHFWGPAPGVEPPAQYRDAAGRLKKQAARFQVFACDRDANGKLTAPPRLVTPADAAIQWSVEVANRKAVSLQVGDPTKRRNGATGDDAKDKDLIIAPPRRSIDSQRSSFDGEFRGERVHLGDAWQEADGSLVFTGGSGRSKRVGPGQVQLNFVDNDGWFDDICDGVVLAEVTPIAGAPQKAVSARVVCAPPDFAPGVAPWITVHDLAYHAAVDRGFRPFEERPSFARFIQPFLVRTTALGAVSSFANAPHGPGHPSDFSASLPQLADASPAAAARRVAVFSRLRHPGETSKPVARRRGVMPKLFNGDEARGGPTPLALPSSIYTYFILWAAGRFVSDAGTDPFTDESIVDKLDRMAMEGCSGGGFFPGIEVSKVVKDSKSWSAAFRLDPSLPPGKLTEGLALPWQADFQDCRYEDDVKLAWWPSQRPDDVLLPSGARAEWARGIDNAEQMVAHFSSLGIVRADASGKMVETERALPEPGNVS